MMPLVRTTLTLDDDVAEHLKAKRRDTGQSFKQVVNDVLRSGLRAGARQSPNQPYELKPASLGEAARGVDLDAALSLADALEDEGIARKLELRK